MQAVRLTAGDRVLVLTGGSDLDFEQVQRTLTDRFPGVDFTFLDGASAIVQGDADADVAAIDEAVREAMAHPGQVQTVKAPRGE